MGNILRFLIVAIVGLFLAMNLGAVILEGLRKGIIGHTDSKQICKRSDNPILFWLLVILFSSFVLLSLFAIWDVGRQCFYS